MILSWLQIFEKTGPVNGTKTDFSKCLLLSMLQSSLGLRKALLSLVVPEP